MCSIYGSKNRSLFDVLHDATIDRGLYAFSYAFIDHKNKKINIKRLDKHPKMDSIQNKPTEELFLGHNQAPTSAQREYNKLTSHPFTAFNWIVAHNGVLTNHKALNSMYCPWNKNVVDSSTIPNLIHAIETSDLEKSEEECVCEALSLIEGTFALWIVNDRTGSVFLARQGSTLFANKAGDFCSIQSKDWIELEEGVLYKINKGLKQVGKFTQTSPFFTL